MVFQHILVPLDGSPLAEQALPVAAHIARATGGSLLLAQVISLPLDYSGGWSPVPLLNEQACGAEIDAARTYLQSLAASPLLAGIETRTEALLGLPVQHLLTLAEAPGTDLVVLCSHGRSGFTRWVLGSVTHALVHQCSTPVLVLRQGQDPLSLFSTTATATGSLRTLVPLDGSPLAEAALHPAARLTAALAANGQGTLHLSQVVKVFPTTAEQGAVSTLNEEALQRARIYLSQVEERLHTEMQALKLTLTHSVELASDVAGTLLNLAEQGKGSQEENGEASRCDLIAISTHGRGGVERWVMGSVTERILNATMLPMLIVRPQKKK